MGVDFQTIPQCKVTWKSTSICKVCYVLHSCIKIIAHLPLMWKKEIYFNLPILQNKSKKISPSFPKCAQLGEGSAFRSALFWCQSGIQTQIWIGIKMARLIRIRIGIILIKMMPLHNTDYCIYNTVPAHMILLYLYYRKIKEKNKTLVSYWRCFDLPTMTLLS